MDTPDKSSSNNSDHPEMHNVCDCKPPESVNCDVRSEMANFWKEHSSSATIFEMMLDNDAAELTTQEQPEILSYLPDFTGKRVIELGAGIGRFTSALAVSAKSVVAVDFIEKFIDKNRASNSSYDNIEFLCADVTRLQRKSKSADLVFSNWLLMYLEDGEVRRLLRRTLEWLDDDGHLFLRESCLHSAGGGMHITENPTYYRDPQLYEAFLETTITSCDGDKAYGFNLVFSKSVDSYIKHRGNGNQIVWLWQKTKRHLATSPGFRSPKEVLDLQKTLTNTILLKERICGRAFISPGGLEATKKFVALLDLRPGQHILDVGCGLGGTALYMAKEFNCKVIGMDLSSTMIKLCKERAREACVGVPEMTFETADVTRRTCQTESFDVIYSRDTVLHIPDKLALFKKFFTWLKPGGKVMILDFWCSPGGHLDIPNPNVKQNGYHLLSLEQYTKLLEEAGFVHSQSEDKRDVLVEVLRQQVTNIETNRKELIQDFSPVSYEEILTDWREQLQRVDQGDRSWGLFYAVKP